MGLLIFLLFAEFALFLIDICCYLNASFFSPTNPNHVLFSQSNCIDTITCTLVNDQVPAPKPVQTVALQKQLEQAIGK